MSPRSYTGESRSATAPALAEARLACISACNIPGWIMAE